MAASFDTQRICMRLRNVRLGKLLHRFEAPMLPEGEVQTLRWLISMRYRIGLLLLLVLAISTSTELIAVGPIVGLYTVNIAYLFITWVYSFMLRGEKGSRHTNLIRQLQMPEKIILCTLAIYFFGGVLTPLFILYPLAVLESIILMNPTGVYRTGALAIGSYCGLALLEAYEVLPRFGGSFGQYYASEFATPTTYALYTLIVSSILMLTTYLANRVSQLIHQRNARIDSQLQDLRSLYDIANGLGNIMDEDSLLQYLATTLKSLQKASICLVGIVNRDGKVELKAGAGAPPGMMRKLRDVSASMPTLATLFERGEPLVIEDVRRYPDVETLLLSSATKSLYVYPIKAESKILGAISLSFDVQKPMTPEYHELMTAIASQAGLAVERARLVCNAQRMANEMSSLYDVGLQTGSTLSRDEIVKRTAGNIEKLLNPDAYYIALYDQENEMISFEMFKEQDNVMPKMRASMENGGLTAHIIQTGQSLLIQDWLTYGDTYNLIAKKTGVEMLSYLGVPMVAEERVVGVISVQCVEPMAFDSHDERLLMALAAQTAMALENAKLHQFAQNQAQFDSLTKVYNHGCFVDLVRKAVVESDSDDSQVALIMLDIDHFKKYNDTYGHVAGDNVLRMVANALKSSVRDTDYVGRWGGEEFGVLLTGVGLTEAKKVARLIRRAVSELYPVDGHGQLIPNPTISQGISSYPFPSATANSLIEQADAALYHAKAHGRNQLVSYEASNSMKEATVTTGHLTISELSRDRMDGMVTITDSLSPKEAALITTDNLMGQSSLPEGLTTTSRLR
jgi:diguanylate cyclase (GGDEF)-like protein